MIDKSNTVFNWHVPALFSNYSQYASRLKLTQIDTNNIIYSGNFSFILMTDRPTPSPTTAPIVDNSEKTNSNFNYFSWWMITIYAVVTSVILLITCCKYCKKKN